MPACTAKNGKICIQPTYEELKHVYEGPEYREQVVYPAYL